MPFVQVKYCGQGRGRTADLPIFRSLDNSSPNITQVRDLHFFIDLNADERRRTYADETKDETTRGSVPGLSCGSP